MVLTRQNVPIINRSTYASADGLMRGAYVLNPVSETSSPPDVILIASGSEVQHIVGAEPALAGKGIKARLVSMPCWELFAEQPVEYRESVLPPSVTARLAVEAGRSLGWERWVGSDGAMISLDQYGASAPGDVVLREFGFTPDHVTRAAEVLVAAERKKSGRQ
jgi:transketolase